MSFQLGGAVHPERVERGDELRSFRACLRWMCIDHTDGLPSAGSWAVFFLLAVAVPSAVTLALQASAPPRPLDGKVQVSLTLAATLAFLSLYSLLRVGLRRLLCIDCLRHDSDEVRADYTAQLSHSFRVLAWFLLPCSLAGGHDAILGFSWSCVAAGAAGVQQWWRRQGKLLLMAVLASAATCRMWPRLQPVVVHGHMCSSSPCVHM
uniref:Uncharacterized protein n=1 Tax=Aegilops tauschii TaxID=37682 RepID=M8BVE7_AEGTA